MIRRTSLAAMALAAVLAFGGATSAADGGWKTDVAPYAWLAGMSGDVTVKGQSAHVNESFSDISQFLDFGGMLHAESRKNKGAILFDAAYIKLSDDRTLIKVAMTESIVELGGALQVLGPESGLGFALDVLAGGRYLYMKSDVNVFGTIDRAGRQDWIDPFVGARVRWGLTKNLLLVVRGDVAGIAGGSESSWNAVGTVSYSVTDSFSAGAGYRAFYDHYEHGNGILDKFEYNANMKGPFVGVGFTF